MVEMTYSSELTFYETININSFKYMPDNLLVLLINTICANTHSDQYFREKETILNNFLK